MSWQDIKHRYHSIDGTSFWAVVDKEGNWCDSSDSFELAVHWAAMDACMNGSLSFEEEVAVTKINGYSIIHSDFLPRLADAGLVI